MSDLAIALIVLAGAIASFKRPWIGAVMSLWISLMSPHVEFGWRARDWPVAQVVGGAMILGLLGTRDRQSPFLGAPVVWLALFWGWIILGFPFSVFVESSTAMLIKVSKIWILVFVTLSLINTREKLDWLVLTLVVSLGFYGVKGGIFTILTGGNYRVWGPGGFVEGNNELALALVALMPMVNYLQMRVENKWAKRAAFATLLLLPLTVLGSHSRGALLGLAAMAFFLWLKGEQKFARGVIFVAVGAGAAAFMPEHWWARMHTIDAYDQDTSAMGRINAWWNAFNVAKAMPFGGGFDLYNPEVFSRYAPDPAKIHAAHSIYFQVLGEHGFIGLFLFMAIGASTWLVCGQVIRLSRNDPELKWASQLGAMLQVSIVGIAVAGAFLSLAYFDMLYYEMAMAVIARSIVKRTLAARASASGAAPGRPPSTPAIRPPVVRPPGAGTR